MKSPASRCSAAAIAGCSGVQVWTNTSPGALPRPARPATWTSSWIGALGGAEVGQVERDVGVEHADQRDARKVEALRDHLGAEQDVGLAAREAAQHLGRPCRAARATSVSSRSTRASGNAARELALGALRASAGEAQQLRAALRAARRRAARDGRSSGSATRAARRGA